MIKLAELLKLREMVYSKKIKPKHQKRMERKLSLFDENLPLPKMDPPTNDSKVTLKELHELAAIKPNVEFVKSGDDVVQSFLPLVEKNEVKVSEEILTRLIKESGRFIYKLKYHHRTYLDQEYLLNLYHRITQCDSYCVSKHQKKKMNQLMHHFEILFVKLMLLGFQLLFLALVYHRYQ